MLRRKKKKANKLEKDQKCKIIKIKIESFQVSIHKPKFVRRKLCQTTSAKNTFVTN